MLCMVKCDLSKHRDNNDEFEYSGWKEGQRKNDINGLGSS